MPERNLAPWQLLTLTQPYEQFCLYGGIGVGKSYIGSNWSIDRIRERPDLRGLIGANTHNQLSQVALQEFYYWLTQYGISYVINAIPPPTWQPRMFQSYDGITTVKVPGHKGATNIFTRVLSKGDNLRGLEFGWYWIDETRDTPEYTHDILLGRLREDKNYRRGLITTTPNGKRWDYKRFVMGAKRGSLLYGSAHVPTTESVKYGIVSQEYLNSLLATYSPLMAQQEIYARHVNVAGGRAYHGWREENAQYISPWGEQYPNASRPLIVGCDFNFSPSPCIWLYGQLSPMGDSIHWFGEIAMVETSTETMTATLIMQCPGFYYRVFGDASGNRGTTSNAGETDYLKMGGVFEDANAAYSIDSDQANPFVKDRVESVNAMLTNGLGQHRMTYNPETCPHLHKDFEVVGFGPTGKIKGSDEQDTHASDAVGYAIYKLFGPHSQVILEPSIPSIDRS